MAEKKNIFAAASDKRKKEQAQINAAVTGTPEPAPATSPRTTMTIAMSTEEKRMLKQFAAAQGKTTAAIVQGWINQYCTNQ